MEGGGERAEMMKPEGFSSPAGHVFYICTANLKKPQPPNTICRPKSRCGLTIGCQLERMEDEVTDTSDAPSYFKGTVHPKIKTAYFSSYLVVLFISLHCLSSFGDIGHRDFCLLSNIMGPNGALNVPQKYI